MTIRLRPHHMLCMLTYIGKGYSSSFVSNYNNIARRLSAGEDIEIIDGPDDICAPLIAQQTKPHCLQSSVIKRDRQAAVAVGALLHSLQKTQQSIAENSEPVRSYDALINDKALDTALCSGVRIQLNAELLNKLRQRFASGEIRSACVGCQWSGLCDQIAAKGYPAVLLRRF